MGEYGFFAAVTGQVPEEAMKEAPEKALPEVLAEDAASCDAPLDAETTMPDEARRVLVYLLRHGVLLAAQKAKMFAQLCRHQEAVRRHLAEVYLYLVLDERQGLAFVATSAAEEDNGDEEDEQVSLITRRALTLYDTLLLLVLRKYYQERENAGEQKIIIDLERLGASLSPFLPLAEHGTLEKKKLITRVNAMIERKLLVAVRGEDERYEITPLIRHVVNADMLHRLLGEYQRLAAEKQIVLGSEVSA